MIHSLAPCFTGTLLRFKDGLALPGEHASSIPGKDLLDTRVAERLLSRFADTHPGGDRRALVSMWTQWHFGALIIPTVAAILLLDRDLPVDLDRVRIALHEDGRTAAVVVTDDGKPQGAGATDRFSRLFDGHVEPLIRHFADHFSVSPRLLWTNASAIFEWTLQQVASFDKACPAAMGESRALLESRTDVKGCPNPMFGAVQYRELDGQRVRRRKICCLRYLLPGIEDCGSLCPLPARGR
jgi:ferric iron reductase protein FhuF